jgi:TIR domain
MSAVFVSYRRADAQGWAGRLGEDLAEAFGDVARFFDLASIPPGADFVVEIERAIARADAALVLIGPRWLDSSDSTGLRRLDNPDDVVRLEVASTLAHSIPVIPVLLGGATMPPTTELPGPLRPLGRRNAVELTDSRWEYDREHLFEALEAQAGMRRLPAAGPDGGGVSVGRRLKVGGSEIGDVTGVRGGGAGGDVEVLRDAELTDVKIGDITGVDLGPREQA